ncbi:hypothetical protein A3A38_00920 [Candidatus Kaiserbacteria bacterium RIFCSPLOWO2_01_FULL_53_17]|uniref:Uncharacterized protein n=1 Tax=Candidatus Kaiserbacteria bacterium RIFCSPLOWO2_01_FULL_53_17 TaxID=1798511 RepID=A0A1F6EH92_9BACT|nr:MAG: hypothetical protein A3A38_00920 [Candidatus Kaiserbacteria bacterium RIFCSPLOWO2_01_FULL_53_17]
MSTKDSDSGKGADVSFSDDELVMIAHLRMRQFSARSALERIERTEVGPEILNSFITRKYGDLQKFFVQFGPIVHERRQRGELPDVQAPVRKPRNQFFHFS